MDGRDLRGARQHLAPRTPDHEASCLTLERQRLCTLGLDKEVVDTLRAPSTQRQYSSKWKVFRDWCRTKREDPFTCNILVILSFLQHLVALGRLESTLRGYLVAGLCQDNASPIGWWT